MTADFLATYVLCSSDDGQSALGSVGVNLQFAVGLVFVP